MDYTMFLIDIHIDIDGNVLIEIIFQIINHVVELDV